MTKSGPTSEAAASRKTDVRVRWTALAKAQAETIRSPELLDRLERRLALLRRFPESGRVIPELGQSDRREVVVDVFRVGYLLRDEEIVIVTILDSRREFRWPDSGRERVEGYRRQVTPGHLVQASAGEHLY